MLSKEGGGVYRSGWVTIFFWKFEDLGVKLLI